MVDYLKISVTSTNFTSCISGKYGGAFYWYYNATYTTSDSLYPFFKSCMFCENSAQYAPDVCICTGSSSVPAGTPFDSNCVTYNSAQYTTGYYPTGSSYTNKQWITKGGSACPKSENSDELNLPEKPLYVNTTGGSTSTSCGSSSSPCSTLAAAYSSTLLTNGTTIVLSPGTHTGSALSKQGSSSSPFTLAIQSANTDTPAVLKISSSMILFTLSYNDLTVKHFSIAVTTSTTCLFMANSNDNYLTIQSMNIYGQGASMTFSSYLLFGDDYLTKLICKDSNISNFTTSSTPLFQLYYSSPTSNYVAAMIEIRDSQFENITTSSTSTGSVFLFTPKHSSVILSGLSFVSCQSSANGGAIYSSFAGMKTINFVEA